MRSHSWTVRGERIDDAGYRCVLALFVRGLRGRGRGLHEFVSCAGWAYALDNGVGAQRRFIEVDLEVVVAIQFGHDLRHGLAVAVP